MGAVGQAQFRGWERGSHACLLGAVAQRGRTDQGRRNGGKAPAETGLGDGKGQG